MYPTRHIPWLCNELQQTSASFSRSTVDGAHSIAFVEYKHVIDSNMVSSDVVLYVMILNNISYFCDIALDITGHTSKQETFWSLVPVEYFRTCLKVRRPFGLSLIKLFPTNIKHLCVWPVWKDVKLLQAGGSSRVQSLLPTKTLWHPWWCTVWSTVCTCSYFKTWWSTNVWFSSFGFRVGKAVVSNTHGT